MSIEEYITEYLMKSEDNEINEPVNIDKKDRRMYHRQYNKDHKQAISLRKKKYYQVNKDKMKEKRLKKKKICDP